MSTSDGIILKFKGSKEKVFLQNESNPIEVKLEHQNNKALYQVKENNQFLILKDKNTIILDR